MWQATQLPFSGFLLLKYLIKKSGNSDKRQLIVDITKILFFFLHAEYFILLPSVKQQTTFKDR